MRSYVAKWKWMPPAKSVPPRVQRSLLSFTPCAKGWTIWYLGKTRYVCAKTVALTEISERWAKLKAVIDSEAAEAKRSPALPSLRKSLSDYFIWLDYRVEHGKPKPLARVSVEDYKRHLIKFASFEFVDQKLADLSLTDFGPEQFKAYSRLIVRI